MDSKEPARCQLDSSHQHRLVRLTRPGVTGSKRYNVVAVRNVVASVYQIAGFEALPLDGLYKVTTRKKIGGNDVRVIHANGDLLDNRVSNLRITQFNPETLSTAPPAAAVSPCTLPIVNEVDLDALMDAIEVDMVPPVELQQSDIDIRHGTMLGAAEDHQEEVVTEAAPPPKRRLSSRSALTTESLQEALLRLTAAEPASWIVGKQ